jgi:hypothetical protein
VWSSQTPEMRAMDGVNFAFLDRENRSQRGLTRCRIAAKPGDGWT